ncbi:CCDC90 family protein [Rodentibacter caecimuris]|nr:CCDC90 family protein [Rodentibacter heylii]
MATIRFDKLRFVKKLQEANQSTEMAEALANALDDALEQSQSPLATKADLKELKAELRLEMSQLRTELTSAMYKMAGLILAGTGVLMSLMKFIN